MYSLINVPGLRMAVLFITVSRDLTLLLAVLQLLLILSGDVELNPGPLDQG